MLVVLKRLLLIIIGPTCLIFHTFRESDSSLCEQDLDIQRPFKIPTGRYLF